MKRVILTIIALVTVSLLTSHGFSDGWCHSLISHVHAIENPTTISNNKFGIHILNTSELDKAAELVNSSGGDWGYVTIPIQPTDRDKDKWQTFMHEAKSKHLIPILRITTIPFGGTWQAGANTDLVDFANFLNDLDWPVKNRYVIIFNEVNRNTEWGGEVEPSKYAKILKNARTIFKERSDDFFILGAALDDALPRSSTSMRAQDYLKAMMTEDPAIWSYVDGWNSHSYSNPGFSAPPTTKGWTSITSYKTEMAYVKIAPKPVFITETGWSNSQLGEDKRAGYLATAMATWQQDNNIVAVTPFLLTAGAGAFTQFSFTTPDGSPTASYATYRSFAKAVGQPTVNNTEGKKDFNDTPNTSSTTTTTLPNFRPERALLKLENLFRKLMGLTEKSYLRVGTSRLSVELATTPKQWEVGLSTHTTLPDNTGMYFIFPVAHIPLFWMKDMDFPIDIIWLRDDQIVDFTLNAPVPTSTNYPTYSPKVPVNRVLEVPAGFVSSHELKMGDSISLIDN